MGTKSPDRVDIEVGQRICLQRKMKGISQTTLADGLGVTFQQVQKYEKGVNRVGAGRLTAVANILEIPVGVLLGVDEDKSATNGPAQTAPLHLLTVPGALSLLRAFGKLKEAKMRRSIVGMVERLGHDPGRPLKKR